MKCKLFYMLILAGLFVFMHDIAQAQTGGPYDLRWNTFDGGGGRSSGGLFVVTGTIGQPDAGFMSAGEFALGGGFWTTNGLCFVNLDDLHQLAMAWLDSGVAIDADLNNNGEVNLVDFRILASWWLRYCPNNWPL